MQQCNLQGISLPQLQGAFMVKDTWIENGSLGHLRAGMMLPTRESKMQCQGYGLSSSPRHLARLEATFDVSKRLKRVYSN